MPQPLGCAVPEDVLRAVWGREVQSPFWAGRGRENQRSLFAWVEQDLLDADAETSLDVRSLDL